MLALHGSCDALSPARRLNRPAVVGVLLAGLLAATATATAATGPISEPARLITTQYLIVLDNSQPPEQTLQFLAAAGFPTTAQVMGLPPRYTNFRIVFVNQADAATLTRLLEVPGVQAVRPVYQFSDGLSSYPILLTGKVVAGFDPGTPVASVLSAAAAAGCTLSREVLGLPHTYVFDVNEREFSPVGAAKRLNATAGVRYAHPGMLIKLRKHAVDVIEDPFFPFQWHHRNTGQLAGGVVGADISTPAAWEITKGESAIVAVIDDCLQRDHEDLKDNYLTGFDFIRQTGDPSPFYGPHHDLTFVAGEFPEDPIADAHGTAVAGIVAARDNQIGVRGVAPRAQLIGCKIGLGANYTEDLDVADAFLFAERNGAMVINNSWGGPGSAILPLIPNTDLIADTNVIKEAIIQVSTRGRGGRGSLVTFSSGNESMLLSFGNRWAGLEHVMAVNATMRNDRLACYSNFGPETSVSAPGGGELQTGCFDSDITTTDNMQVEGNFPYVLIDNQTGEVYRFKSWPIRGYNTPMKFLNIDTAAFCPPQDDAFLDFLFQFYFGPCPALVPDPTIDDFPNEKYTHHMNGTSAACPNASGVAALVFSLNNNLTAVEVRNIVEHTADKIQSPNETFDRVTGHNPHFGHGRVNALNAVLAAQAGRTWPSPVKDVQRVSSQSLVRLTWTNPDWDNDGVTDSDVAAVLVVRAPAGQLHWAPVDGAAYQVGQIVAPGVVVVANDLIDSLDQTGLSQGSYQYALFVRNASNYYSWGRRTGFDSTGAVSVPLASIQASVTTGAAPLAVHFAGGGIDQSGIVGFNWNFGDGNQASGPAVDYTYTTPGNYTVSLTVTNALGQTAGTTARINVLPANNAPPVVQATATPRSGTAPLVVLLQASATDADGTIVRYDWNFGDGSDATGQVIEHIYLDPGTYGVTVTATDNAGGQGMTSLLVTVNAATTTAGEVVSDNTRPFLSLPFCGSGAAGAVMMAAFGLLGLMALRRRV